MARPVNANAAETKGRILEAASRLFAEQGQGQVSIRQIAKQADVSLGMVNHYFGSKDELFEACIESMYEELSLLRETLMAEVLTGGSLSALIDRAVRTGFRFGRAHQPALRLVMRAVVDRGMLDEARQESFQRPFLAEASMALGQLLGREPEEMRPVIQSLVFIIVRYALGNLEELAFIAGVEGRPTKEALSRIEAHLVGAAHALLGLPFVAAEA